MTNPHLDLPAVTAKLESLGFEARTKLLFRRGFVDVIIVDGILPDNTPPDLITPPLFSVKIYTDEHCGSFDCPIDGLHVLDYQ
jgi:hypothetical protein